tara:strand:+ start:46 stop:960 length:915 start_codon:yes stop_codon:yes gene_type:complete
MTSIVFPGQGSQFIGMSKDFYDNFSISRAVLEEIEESTKLQLKKIIFEDPDNLLNLTQYTQICTFAASVMIFKALESSYLDNSKIDVMLGHSLGEYSALACSNKLDLNDCSIILKKRGKLMSDTMDAGKSSMAALIGLSSSEVEKIISDNEIDLEIANDNSPIQVVVSGLNDIIDKSKEIFLANKIKKFIKLNVSAAFHSRYMLGAEKLLNLEIDKVNFIKNEVNIISNYSAEISNDTETIKNSLKRQMSNKVRWTESIKKLSSIGVNKIIEIGPGNVLSGLIKRISNNFDLKTINNISEIKNI